MPRNENIKKTSESEANPNKNQFSKNCYRCVIYFGVVDFEAERPNVEKLDWIYIWEGE